MNFGAIRLPNGRHGGITFAAVLAVALALVSPASPMSSWAGTAAAAATRSTTVIDPALAHQLERTTPAEPIDLIVTLNEQANLDQIHGPTKAARLRRVIAALKATAASSQAELLQHLRAWKAGGAVSRFQSFWVIDAVAVRARASLVPQLAAIPGVRSIELDAHLAAPAAIDAPPSGNISQIGVPNLWAQGLTGHGVVIANMDSGVDVSHPDLSASWRGGTNSWFDPNGEHPTTPTDLSGHGTWTMGVMVGGQASGTAIGIAPGAHWIATKIFDDRGVASTSGIHSAFQWLLDPDGDPLTADAPDVVEASWSLGAPGCTLTFEPDLQALRAAEILPVFAAGNGGPVSGSSYSPANNPSAFAVGAVDAVDAILPLSSRGPSTCGGSTDVFPDVVAPGETIPTTDLFGFYTTATGTSMSAPHVAGTLALLLEAFPSATASQQETALAGSSIDLGDPGPDDVYGDGRVDALAAYQLLSTFIHPPPPAPPLVSIGGDKGYPLGTLNDVHDEDVLSLEGTTFGWALDGSDLGVTADVDAVARIDPDSLLLSFDVPTTLPALGPVDDSDLVRFDAAPLGETTAGTFSMSLDGSDVGLTKSGEDLDAVEIEFDGSLLISTRGSVTVPGLAGAQDEDVLRFVPSALGDVTDGTFEFFFDGSDVGFGNSNAEDIDALALAEDGRLLISTNGNVTVPGITAQGEDVIACTPVSVGAETACTFDPTPAVDGTALGLGGSIGLDAYDA